MSARNTKFFCLLMNCLLSYLTHGTPAVSYFLSAVAKKTVRTSLVTSLAPTAVKSKTLYNYIGSLAAKSPHPPPYPDERQARDT